jgi:HAD superfamily hydrolase (TIGR01509 family)
MLFDLDGVITQTATAHAAAWKRLFDGFVEGWCRAHGQPFRPFDIGTDYVNHVDGRMRYEGVNTFLRSRGIELAYGAADDSDDEVTCCGLGNRKDRYFAEQLGENGAEVFVDTAQLIDALSLSGKRLAVVSASQNCEAVLRRAGLLDRFDARVTGVEAARLGLAGKPARDTFLKAAELFGVEPRQAVVFEDAISGVQAGRSGRFGLVVGVDRRSDPEPLAANGADVVVSDLTALLPLSADGGRAEPRQLAESE